MSKNQNKQKKTNKEMSTLFVQNIPNHAKTAFKAACARKNQTMQQAILQLITTYSA